MWTSQHAARGCPPRPFPSGPGRAGGPAGPALRGGPPPGPGAPPSQARTGSSSSRLASRLAEPRGGLRGRVRAAGAAPEAEMPQLQVVPGERVPGDADVQRHPHVRRGTTHPHPDTYARVHRARGSPTHAGAQHTRVSTRTRARIRTHKRGSPSALHVCVSAQIEKHALARRFGHVHTDNTFTCEHRPEGARLCSRTRTCTRQDKMSGERVPPTADMDLLTHLRTRRQARVQTARPHEPRRSAPAPARTTARTALLGAGRRVLSPWSALAGTAAPFTRGS